MAAHNQHASDRHIVSLQQHGEMTLATWIDRGEVGCEVVGDADELEELNPAELCADELNRLWKMPGVRMSGPLRVHATLRFTRVPRKRETGRS